MAWEVDFIHVGEGEKSGDAIALRWGNLSGPRSEQTILVIDGGTQDSGERLVAHIKKFYGTTRIDAAILSHPDADHASGLSVVLENLEVGTLFMHQPWKHAEFIAHLFNDGRVTATGLEDRVWKALQYARDLEKIADRKGIPIAEPFSDTHKYVLSPSIAFYQQQLVRFRCMPEQKALAEHSVLMEQALAFMRSAVRAMESWFTETLADPAEDATSGENNSSVVLLLDMGGEKFLFTADAGVPALEQAIARATALGIDLATVKHLQIPHHGSKRNIGPTVLDKIAGPILPEGSVQRKSAFVSAAKDSPKHPAKKVVNAYLRRGVKVFSTAGKSIRQGSPDAPPRAGYTSISPMPFHHGEADE